MKHSLTKLLEDAKSSDYFCLLNPNGYNDGFPLTFALGQESVLWEQVPEVSKYSYFGYLSYDFKDQFFRGLSSNLEDWQKFPVNTFFKATKVFKKDQIIDDLIDSQVGSSRGNFEAKVSREEYLKTVNHIKKDILNGDVYELTYCIPFVLEDVDLDPVDVYRRLNSISPMPFSSLLKLKDCWLIGASPERYFKKVGNKVVSQPIKGTIRRGKTKVEDNQLIEELRQSEKEQAENLMIVDLVRNDLNRCCKPTTVKVDELFGIYEFPQVHQMISTISGELNPSETVKSMIEKTFPMGSMTGAPKLKAIELIEEYEVAKRGVFSGSVGFMDAYQNADFNVVIRSLIYNQTTKTLSFMVGSAITYDSDAVKEYEECLLKASAMMKCFQ
jgi:para-aminobenzoate synthetase component 1